MARLIRSRGRLVAILISVAVGVAARTASAQSGLVCVGYGGYGDCNPPALPPGLVYTQLSASQDRVMALRSDGSIIGWGTWSPAPALPPGVIYVEVATGGFHTLARRSDGSVVAWGQNWAGQCDVPALPSGLTYVEIAASAAHSLARRSDGSVVAWGANYYGQCDVPALPPGLTYVEVAAGDDYFGASGYSLARRSDGSVAAWGYMNFNPNGLTYVELAAGAWNALARHSDGSVAAWGQCEEGECSVPGLPSGLTYVQLAAGEFHCAALRSDGSVVAWGDNFSGECNVPPPPSGAKYVEVKAGDSFTIARYAGCPTCELPFCLGDAGPRSVPCPCGNNGTAGHGCDNSLGTGGAMLSVRGSVAPDQVALGCVGELPSALTIFFQGKSVLESPSTFGDGVRCIGGSLKRLGAKVAVAGSAGYPGPGDPSISTRSAALGDLIRPGTFRYYQVYYHDTSASFCNPPRATFNASNAVMVAW